MSAAKGGRKVVKANRVSRSKPGTKTLLRPSAPPCADFEPKASRSFTYHPPNEDVIVSLLELQEFSANYRRHVADCRMAVRDCLQFYDRLAGNIKDGTGWSVAEVRRLAEIRVLIAGPAVPANSSPAAPQTQPEAIPSQASPENRRKSAPRA